MDKADSRGGQFAGRCVLVTGAGRGIGKRLAMGLSASGGNIILVGRNRAELDLAHMEIEQAGGAAIRVTADVTDPEQMRMACERGRIAFGSAVDVLICAAGITGPLRPFSEIAPSKWRQVLEVNLMGVVNTCHAVLPGMIEKRRGKIIGLTCECDHTPHLNFSAYATSKTAVVRFIEGLAAEVVHQNIQANCLDTGPAYTSLTDEIISAADRLEPKVVAEAQEVRRTGGTAPELQMSLITFLASERSNHITGKLFHVSDDWKKWSHTSLRPDALTLRRAPK